MNNYSKQQIHWQGRPDCLEFVHSVNLNSDTHNNQITCAGLTNATHVDNLLNNDINVENMDDCITYEINDNGNNELIECYQKYLLSGYYDVLKQNDAHTLQIQLLHILKKSKVPLYLFDEIVKWANKYKEIEYDEPMSRPRCIYNIMNQYDLHALKPIQKKITLDGSKHNVTLVTHDFKQSLYSILNDDNIMQVDNLLLSGYDFLNSNHIIVTNEKGIIDDIDTGSVYQEAKEKYITKDSNEILCPLIFFIDKTHTDTHGRLCLEQIRFTLGILNRTTRNKPESWRTLGYITDQALIPTEDAIEKVIDYHHMMTIILSDFKDCQEEKFEWFIKNENGNSIKIKLVLAVLFIIGDTDGQDKIIARYTARTGVASLCRYCSTPFDETDNPEYKFQYYKHNTMMKAIEKSDAASLRQLCMHKVCNAWKDIRFCDPSRGLYGAVCADILHCLQHGLFMYAHQALFDHKTAKKNTEEGDIEPIYSNRNVFSKSYSKHFEALTLRYGKLLSHQSDRDLPRTYISTNYTTTTRKNANEMSGVLLVILIIFLTNEGENKLDQAMANIESSKFIHVLELLLMLENFCLTGAHKSSDIRQLKKFMPFLLNTYKETINRTTGNGMKLIKFHLPNHFADDMLRFGSMLNFDTGIGESHHKTEAKHPAKNTQRRKANFELQTATRQIENLAINIAMADIQSDNHNSVHQKNSIDTITNNKIFRYLYDKNKNQIQYKKNRKKCVWDDYIFQQQLMAFFKYINDNNLLNCEEIELFTQHNRDKNIFRADPRFNDDNPWNDWVLVKWTDDKIPAKLMIFWEIEETHFIKPFQWNDIYIGNAGTYAFIYSLSSSSSMQKAHCDSLLTEYGVIDLDTKNLPKLYVIETESIASTLSAVPYKCEDNYRDALEWIFLKPKCEWYSVFTELMNRELKNYTL